MRRLDGFKFDRGWTTHLMAHRAEFALKSTDDGYRGDKIYRLSKMKNNLLNLLKQDFKRVDLVTVDIEKHDIFNNDEEKEIFKINMNSLEFFEFIREYKYCMVAMGSIIEFLLKRYCKLNGIKPEPYTDPFGKIVPAYKKDFVNYTQSAIINDILGQRNSWFIVQNNLRNFRNYVHIEKEIKEEKIDDKWYEIIRPAYEKILQSFKLK